MSLAVQWILHFSRNLIKSQCASQAGKMTRLFGRISFARRQCEIYASYHGSNPLLFASPLSQRWELSAYCFLEIRQVTQYIQPECNRRQKGTTTYY